MSNPNSNFQEVAQKVTELTELSYQIHAKKSNGMLKAWLLVIAMLLIFVVASYSQNAQQMYIQELVIENGKNVTVGRKTSTENVKPTGTAKFEAYVKTPTPYKCGRAVAMFLKGDKFWKSDPIWLGCENHPFGLEIEAGEYAITSIPLEMNELAFLTVETTGGETLFSQTIGYAFRNDAHSFTIPQGAEVKLVISNGNSH